MSGINASNRVAWHPAFYEAIRAELVDYLDVLEFHQEYQLNAEPLRIDVLVIKKRPDVIIEKNIGRVFRQVNIVEYKSPNDTLTPEDFYKVISYAGIYRAGHRETEITDMSLSFVVGRHPRQLVRHLRKVWGLALTERYPGIRVTALGRVPVQIIESGKLPEEENLWLRNLVGGLEVERLDAVLRQHKEYIGQVGRMGAYLEALMTVNRNAAKKGVKAMHPEIIEAIKSVGLDKKWREEAREEGYEEGLEEGRMAGLLVAARAMFVAGDSLEKIARVTQIPMDKLRSELRPQ